MNLDEMLAKRPADEEKVAEHKRIMEQELEEVKKPKSQHVWRHSDWD